MESESRERERQRAIYRDRVCRWWADLHRRHLQLTLFGVLRLRLTISHNRLQLNVGELFRDHRLRLQLVQRQAARNVGSGRRRRPALPIERHRHWQHGQWLVVCLVVVVVAGRQRFDGQMRNGAGQLDFGHLDELLRLRLRMVSDLQTSRAFAEEVNKRTYTHTRARMGLQSHGNVNDNVRTFVWKHIF